MKKFLLLVMWLTMSCAQVAQVIAVRGTVEIGYYGHWYDVRTGAHIQSKSLLRVSKNSYVAIITKHHKGIEIKVPGVYDVDSLMTQQKQSVNAHTERYTGYVLNQAIACGSNRFSGKDLGAVSRSILGVALLTPNHTTFYDHLVILEWYPVRMSQGYCVEIVNSSGRIVYIKDLDTNSTQLAVDMTKIDNQDSIYYWRVSTHKYPSLWSQYRVFKLIRGKDKLSLLNEEREVKSEIQDYTALGQSILGAFYEHKGLYEYALQCYRKSCEIEPEVPLYCNMYYELITKTEKNY